MYIYNYNNITHQWDLTKTLQSVGGDYTYFGSAVQIYGDKIIVGAPGQLPTLFEDGPDLANNTGAAYIYQRVNDSWIMTSTLLNLAGYNSYFGYDVDIHSSNAIVGAYGYGIKKIFLIISFIISAWQQHWSCFYL